MGTQTFLALDEPFVPVPTRASPRVWIRRVALFAEPDRELRNFALTPGLNVIWAPDAEPDQRLGSRMGHGAGKTLLCRMMRHLLGEPDLASPDDAAAVKARFPHGFVAAEVVVQGRPWAVLRPFDPARGSVTMPDAEMAAILDADPDALRDYDELLDAVRGTLGGSRETLASLGDPWLAAVAWSSRDQERRFGGGLRWRDRASCPSSKLARVANLERVRVIRSLLRVRGPEDLDAERAAKELEVEEKTTIRQLADCEREVLWLSSRIGRERQQEAADLVTQPLQLRALVTALIAERDALDDVVETASATGAILIEATAALEAALREESSQSFLLAQRQRALDALRAHAEDPAHDASCELCSVTAPKEGTRDPAKAAARALEAQQKTATRATKALGKARARLGKAEDAHRAAQRERWGRWAAACERLTRAEDLARLLERRETLFHHLQVVQTKLAAARADRESAMRGHAKRVGHVEKVFDFVVRRLAGQDVSGRLKLSATELDASICLADGRRGTSPALRVLETLALDLCALILATEDRTDLPGLWIHDSPREADLARSHYDALYRLAAWLEDATPTAGFQYIVTTTTSPPASVAFRALRLGAAENDQLLLRTPL